MPRKRYPFIATAATTILATSLLLTSTPGSQVGAAPAIPGPVLVYRVNAPVGDTTTKLLDLGLDVMEQRDGNDLFVTGDRTAGQKLRTAGFAPAIDQMLDVPQWKPVPAAGGPTIGPSRPRLPHHWPPRRPTTADTTP